MKLLSRPLAAASLLAALTVLNQTASAKDIFDMSTLDHGCRIIAKTRGLGRGVEDAAQAGTCSGIIGTLMVTGSHFQPNMRICAPADATAEQGIKVFVRYLDTHPARLHEAAIILAIDSLREAWPCPRAN